MSRKALMSSISRAFEAMKTAICDELEEAPHVSTTCDIWSHGNRSFLGMTVHTFLLDLSRKSYAIACRRIKGTHDYRKVTDEIKAVLDDWGIQWKTAGMVTDNASNFGKAFREFGTQPTQAGDEPEGPDMVPSEGGPQYEDDEDNEDEVDDVDVETLLDARDTNELVTELPNAYALQVGGKSYEKWTCHFQ